MRPLDGDLASSNSLLGNLINSKEQADETELINNNEDEGVNSLLGIPGETMVLVGKGK